MFFEECREFDGRERAHLCFLCEGCEVIVLGDDRICIIFPSLSEVTITSNNLKIMSNH